MRVVTVIQARTGSTRLPGKIMLPLNGKPVLARMVERVRSARLAGEVVVATTKELSDDVVVDLCRNLRVTCVRGSTEDCLDRHFQVAKELQADALVKIPSDCPLIDPDIIDNVLEVFCESNATFDYVSNLHPQSFPDGNDVEVMSAEALSIAWKEARKTFEREHTTPYLWDRPERFRVGNVVWDRGDFSKTHRWTLDYPEDYQLIRTVFEELSPKGVFSVEDIIALLDEKPEIRALNRMYLGDGWYTKHRHELKTWGNELQ